MAARCTIRVDPSRAIPAKVSSQIYGTNYNESFILKEQRALTHVHMPYLIDFGKRTASILDKGFPLALLLATKTQCNALSELA